jgi:hypothetical protein
MVQYVSKKKIKRLFDKILEEVQDDEDSYKSLELIRDEIMKL